MASIHHHFQPLMRGKYKLFPGVVFLLLQALASKADDQGDRALLNESVPAHHRVWTKEQANQWYAKQPWLVGCNFLPSSEVVAT